jgi:hypothetical protein
MFVYLHLNKKGERRGYKNVKLETMMNKKTDKTVKYITHHVPLVYTKKQIEWNHENR